MKNLFIIAIAHPTRNFSPKPEEKRYRTYSYYGMTNQHQHELLVSHMAEMGGDAALAGYTVVRTDCFTSEKKFKEERNKLFVDGTTKEF